MILRTLQPIIKIFAEKNKIIIINGARQVGKTTLTEMIVKKNKDSVIRFNGDEPDICELFSEIICELFSEI